MGQPGCPVWAAICFSHRFAPVQAGSEALRFYVVCSVGGSQVQARSHLYLVATIRRDRIMAELSSSAGNARRPRRPPGCMVAASVLEARLPEAHARVDPGAARCPGTLDPPQVPR